MKKKEIKKLTKSQINKDIDKLKKDLFNFRFQKINSQLKNPAKISETKKRNRPAFCTPITENPCTFLDSHSSTEVNLPPREFLS